MKLYFILLLIVFFKIQYSCAQNQVSTRTDSLLNTLQHHSREDTSKVNLLNAISREYYITNCENPSSLTYAQNALDLAKKLEYKKGQAIALRYAGNYYSCKRDSAKTVDYYEKSMAIFAQINDHEGLVTNLYNLGNLYTDFLNYTQSAIYFQDALTLSEKTGVINSLCNIHLGYGYLFYRTLNFPRALEHYQKALEIAERRNNNQERVNTLGRMGEVYFHLQEFEKTLEYIEKIIKIYTQSGNHGAIAGQLSWKANILMNIGEYEESLKIYEQSIEKRKELNDEIGLADDYANVAFEYQILSDFITALKYHNECFLLAKKHKKPFTQLLYFKDMGHLILKAPDSVLTIAGIDPGKRFQTAVDYEIQALKLAEGLDDTPQKLMIGNNLIEAYEKLGDYKSAYKYYKKFTMLNDSMVGQNTKSEIARKEAQSIFEKKEAAAKAEHEKTRLRLWIIVGVILMFAIAGFSMYYITRLKKMKERQILLAGQQVIRLEKERTENELEQARTDIKQFLKNISDKNAVISIISNELDKIKNDSHTASQNLAKSLSELKEKSILTNDDWLDFLNSFNKLYPDFAATIKEKHPSITASELRYLMLSKLGLEHKEMANTLGVTPDAIRVTWNRTRAKLNGSLGDTPQSLLMRMGINN